MPRGTFQICLMDNTLFVKMQQDTNFTAMSIFMDGYHVGTFTPMPVFRFDVTQLSAGVHFIDVGLRSSSQNKLDYRERFCFWRHGKAPSTRDFQAGDILVSCDNVNGLPIGYMGHSAIVADPNHLIEAVIEPPFIRKDSIEQLLQAHPIHAHYRPLSKDFGQKAVAFANTYLQMYNDNVQKGKQLPPFSFSPNIPLTDPWGCVYCSKLVWLSYYYGANYPFFNDYLLFAPEDLEDALSHDANFVLLYKHQDFVFNIDL